MFFTKKKPVEAPKEWPKPIILTIPEDKVEEFWRLYDTDKAEKTGLSNYKLWRFIADIFPGIKDGRWAIVRDDILNPCIIKRQDY